jgi:hypothetical protein
MGRRYEREGFASTHGTSFIKFPQYLGRIGIADAEFETPQAKLHWISEWSTANEGDHRSKEKPHFPETHRKLLVGGQSRDDGLLARLE